MPPPSNSKPIFIDLTNSDVEEDIPPRKSSAPGMRPFGTVGGLSSTVSPSVSLEPLPLNFRNSTANHSGRKRDFSKAFQSNGHADPRELLSRAEAEVHKSHGHKDFKELLSQAEAEAQAAGYDESPQKVVKGPDLFDLIYSEPKRPRKDNLFVSKASVVSGNTRSQEPSTSTTVIKPSHERVKEQPRAASSLTSANTPQKEKLAGLQTPGLSNGTLNAAFANTPHLPKNGTQSISAEPQPFRGPVNRCAPVNRSVHKVLEKLPQDASALVSSGTPRQNKPVSLRDPKLTSSLTATSMNAVFSPKAGAESNANSNSRADSPLVRSSPVLTRNGNPPHTHLDKLAQVAAPLNSESTPIPSRRSTPSQLSPSMSTAGSVAPALSRHIVGKQSEILNPIHSPSVLEFSPRIVSKSDSSPLILTRDVKAQHAIASTQVLGAEALHTTSSAAAHVSPYTSLNSSHVPSTHHAASPSRARRFDRTVLASRQGRPYTDAEIIMVGYLYERLGLAWSDIDVKMGRSHNTCATKHCRIPTGLKNNSVKIDMKWYDRARAIDAMLATQDLDIEQAVLYLQRFIDTSSLPKGAADEYERLAKIEPNPAFDAYTPVQRPTSLHAPSALQQNASYPTSTQGAAGVLSRPRRHIDENAMVSNRLRPGARLADGQLDVKAMVGLRMESPESIGRSDSERKSMAPAALIPSIKSQYTLFNTEVERDEYLPGAFIQRKKPYLNARERELLKEAVSRESQNADIWYGFTLHHDFNCKEQGIVEQAARALCPKLEDIKRATPAQLAAITAYLDETRSLRTRGAKSVRSYLQDMASVSSMTKPQRLRLGYKSKSCRNWAPTSYTFRRELGLSQSKRRVSHRALQDDIYDSLVVTRSFIGTSGDVGSIAWSPNGQHFAAGSVCLVDSSSMQYNRPNNLLFGSTERGTIYELPHHHSKRTRPPEGVNSTHSMHVSQDPRLFQTVSMVDFASDGSYMLSTGYDKYLRAFKIGDTCEALSSPSYQGAKIDLLTINRHNGLVATGAAETNEAIRVYSITESGFSMLRRFGSARANSHPDKKIMPSSLKWGSHPAVSNCLLAGFATNATSELNAVASMGELCLWDVEAGVPMSIYPGAGNIFDCAWSPNSARLASACVAYGNKVNRGTKSFVRIYDPLRTPDGVRWSMQGLELDCKALDINDVVFCPYDENYISAGATDGTVHVWDIRNPTDVLHSLAHGEAVMELDSNYARGLVDTGVRFCAWGHSGSRLYSGSSDGVLKVWDIHRSTEDAHLRDVASFNSGIMSGAFNTDFSGLLIGEVNGSINLLEVCAEGKSGKELERFTLEPFDVDDTKTSGSTLSDLDSGINAARDLLAKGQIEIQPFGGYPLRQAVQGPQYGGPYDFAESTLNLRKKALHFQNRMFVEQPEKQCKKHLCKQQGRHFSSEEISDSERWKDRVPQKIRDRARGDNVPAGMLKCIYCGAGARVREDDLHQAAYPMCERCSFACLRCGTAIKIAARVEEVNCNACALSWEMGALGFDLITTPFERDVMEEVVRGTATVAQDDAGALGNLEDMLSLVEEYHHSLWEDRQPTSF